MNYVKSFNLFGVEAKEIPCITGKGVPSTATKGDVGCLYMDENTGYIYKCTAVTNGVYTWTSDAKTINATLAEHGISLSNLEESIATETAERKHEIAVERARIDNFATLEEGSTTGDAELQGIRVGYDAKTYATAGEAVRGQIQQVSEIVGSAADLANLWTHGDQTFTRSVVKAIDLPAGEYTIKATAVSTDTDSTACAVVFYNGDTVVKTIFAEPRGSEWTKVVAFDQSITKMELRASSDYPKSAGDTGTFTDISIVDNNATNYLLTAKDDVARKAVADANSDLEYVQNPNLYDGEWKLGRLVYDTGKPYAGDSAHCMNVNPVILDPTKEYNVMVKTEYVTSLYVYSYDAAGNFIERKESTASVVHISGASSINFHAVNYSTLFPDEPLHIMVWESNEPNKPYAEWLEYGEVGSYRKTKQILDDDTFAKAILSRDKARFDDSFNYIAYSQVTGSAGSINTAEHFIWAAKQGFTSLKGDVRPTSDGVLIMCHDAGFTLNSSGHIVNYNANSATPIHDMTAEQCLALQHSGTLQNVCSFDKYIKICKKYGMIAYITIRDEYMDEVVPTMLAVLDKYCMRQRCIVNSFDLSSLQAVRNADGNIMLSQVLPSGLKISNAYINNAISLGNCMICGFDFPGFGEYADLDEEVLAYARTNDIRLYQAQINSMEHIDNLMEYGITGAQMTVVPEI